MIQRFAGQIRQFYLGQARAGALALGADHRGMRDTPQLRMRYTKLHGQEILDLTFAPEVVEQVKRPPRPVRERYEMAVVDVRVPNRDAARIFRALAFTRVPQITTLTPASVPPLKGIASGGGPAGPEFMLDAPTLINGPMGPVAHLEASTGTEFYASYLIDFRTVREVPVLAFDLYTETRVPDFITPGYQLHVSPVPIAPQLGEVDVPLTSVTGPTAYRYPQDNNGTFYSDDPVPDPPDIYYDMESMRWLFVATGTQSYSALLWTRPTSYIDGATGIHVTYEERWNDWWIESGTPSELGYSGPRPLAAEVNVTLLRTAQEFDILRAADFDSNYNRWVPKGWPGVTLDPTHSFACSVAVTSVDASASPLLSEHYSIPLTGTVTFNVDEGAVSFKPAG